MPILLDGSNINVNYSTSNFDIQCVKSELYIPDTNVNTSNILNIPIAMAPETQPLTNEPVITSPSFTESIRTFTHSGGVEAQTTHTITIGQNTICDILIVGGGGGGSAGHGGGGGAGQLILIHQAILSGTYTITVGKGGIGGRSSELANSFPATKGSNSSFGTVIAEGGGANTNVSSDKDGGSGAGGDGWNSDGGTSGFGNKTLQ